MAADFADPPHKCRESRSQMTTDREVTVSSIGLAPKWSRAYSLANPFPLGSGSCAEKVPNLDAATGAPVLSDVQKNAIILHPVVLDQQPAGSLATSILWSRTSNPRRAGTTHSHCRPQSFRKVLFRARSSVKIVGYQTGVLTQFMPVSICQISTCDSLGQPSRVAGAFFPVLLDEIFFASSETIRREPVGLDLRRSVGLPAVS
jgi:hypothetical protein